MEPVPTVWWELPLVGFDLETTGVDVETDRIVTANITWHHPVREPSIRNFLLNPGIEIPEQAAAVHGITTEHARAHGQDAREGIAEILSLLRKCAHLPFVAYNGVFDFTMLDREARRYGLEPFAPTFMIDPMVCDKAIDGYRRGGRKLTTVCEVYGVTLDNAHTADADALATILVARALGRTGKLPSDLRRLFDLQVGWKAWQDREFREWLAKKGEAPRDPNSNLGYWPITPVGAAAAA